MCASLKQKFHNKRGRTLSDDESDDKVAKRSRKKSPKRGRQEDGPEDEHLKQSRKKSSKRSRQETRSEDEDGARRDADSEDEHLKQSRKKSSKRSRQETQSEDEDGARRDADNAEAAKKIRKAPVGLNTFTSPSAAVSSSLHTPSNSRTPLASPESSRSNKSSNKKSRMVQLEMELLHFDLKNVAHEEEHRKRKEAMVLKRRIQRVRRMAESDYDEESEVDEL